MFRIGHGYDIHKFSKDRDLILGGVKIPHKYGLLGHSDADVLAHAIIDAVLGAQSLGNVGTFFPDTDNKYKNADSMKLLAEVIDITKKNEYELINLDCTIITEEPKINPYSMEIRKNISNVFDVKLDQISVKSSTDEGLGCIGNKEGIRVHCVCLLQKKEKNYRYL